MLVSRGITQPHAIYYAKIFIIQNSPPEVQKEMEALRQRVEQLVKHHSEAEFKLLHLKKNLIAVGRQQVDIDESIRILSDELVEVGSEIQSLLEELGWLKDYEKDFNQKINDIVTRRSKMTSETKLKNCTSLRNALKHVATTEPDVSLYCQRLEAWSAGESGGSSTPAYEEQSEIAKSAVQKVISALTRKAGLVSDNKSSVVS